MPASAPPELTGDDDVLADSREELEGLMGDPGADLPPNLQPRFEEACRLLKVGRNESNDSLLPDEGRLEAIEAIPCCLLDVGACIPGNNERPAACSR